MSETVENRTPSPWAIHQFCAADTEDGHAQTAIMGYLGVRGELGATLGTVNRWTFGDEPPSATSEANAQFIVLACNFHDELVTMLGELLSEQNVHGRITEGTYVKAVALLINARMPVTVKPRDPVPPS